MVDLVEVKLEVMESLEYKTIRFELFSSFNEEPSGLSSGQSEMITWMFWDNPALSLCETREF